MKLSTKHLLCAAWLTMEIVPAFAQQITPVSQMEHLNRGLVALPAAGENGNFLSWRLLGTDSKDVCFDVERDGKLIAKKVRLTNFTDAEGTPSSKYRILTYQSTKSQKGIKKTTSLPEMSQVVTPWTNLYKSIPIDRPMGAFVEGRMVTYSPNDCSVGDVDGDGEYELILKWDPSNSHDNAHDGYTNDVILDCYKMNGTKLWRINLGKNIRAGAHYTQFMVYDFDGDGKVEMICKTAPGSVDGAGKFVSDAATDEQIKRVDNQADYRNEKGRILTGPEFLTVFNGETGKAIHTVWYNPNRAQGVGGSAEYAKAWGDHTNNANRGERYLAGVAFLDGPNKNPSAVMCRGYYTGSFLWAVDFDGKQLHTKWLHASTTPNDWTVTDGNGKIVKEAHHLKNMDAEGHSLSATAYGQGAHSLAVADVDGDGCDEITYGSAAIDHDGTLLYSTGLGHGDAQHLGDLDPDRPGLEYYMVHEAYPYGSDLRDARTGKILYHDTDKEDTGRGVAADIDAQHRGSEFWCTASDAIHDIKGHVIAHAHPALNFRIYWDGDLQDELLANLHDAPHFAPYIQKWNGKDFVALPLSNGKQLYEVGNTVSCNGTKATPNIQADLFGDWREEVIYWDSSDAAHLNIFTTNIPTDYRVPTLMHDHVYRMGVAWQNTCYNQPPHLGYYLPDKAEKIKK